MNSKQLKIEAISFLKILMFSVFTFGIYGCGGGQDDSPPKVIVSGEVTYDGTPITFGSIRFLPLAESGLPVAAATIRNGRYEADNKGGVPVGTHRVEVAWLPSTSAKELEDSTMSREKVPEIPSKYNSETILELVVPPGLKTLEQDFHLK